MTLPDWQDQKFEVVILGSGVAGLEAALALHELAGDRVALTLITPDSEFRYRPLAVREPFTAARSASYPLASIAEEAGARLLTDRFKWLDAAERVVHTAGGEGIPYDALLIALGAKPHALFRDAITIDDHRLGEQLADFVAALDVGSLHTVAFVVPSLPIWSLPAYELALMTATRAAAHGHQVGVLLITPEDAPLAALGIDASAEVARLLAQTGVTTITSASAQIREPGKINLYPMRRSLNVDAVIALPELYAPAVPGVATSAERGFLTIDHYGAVHGLHGVFAAGDITDTPVKHGGLSAEQGVVAAQAIAALAGAPVEPKPLRPALHVMLLGGAEPLFIRSQMLGEHGSDAEVSHEPLWRPVGKLHSEYLGPCLARLDTRMVDAAPGPRPTSQSSGLPADSTISSE
jgi:sulfide:quinone oxidoreductase